MSKYRVNLVIYQGSVSITRPLTYNQIQSFTDVFIYYRIRYSIRIMQARHNLLCYVSREARSATLRLTQCSEEKSPAGNSSERM